MQNCIAQPRVLLTALGAAALLATASAASAQPGTVYLTTWLRSGPGDQYAVLDEVDPQSQVDVEACGNGWCRVASSRAKGFIKASVLSAPDLHRNPPGAAQGANCFTAQLNGSPRSGDDVRVCGQ